MTPTTTQPPNMEPMDARNTSEPHSKPRTTPSFAPGGTAQIFRSAPSPMDLVSGTQSPFHSNPAARAVPTAATPTFKAAGTSMTSCGAASPFATFPQNVTLSTSTVTDGSPARSMTENKSEPTKLSDSSHKPLKIDPSKYINIPDEMPHLTPSYPAALFGGLSADDEHVTVWEPATGKTVAGNAAPYRRNLKQWLESHKGWEEKADELKSSKRRAAARRSKQAATNFASLCAFPVAKSMSTRALKKFKDSRVPRPEKSLSTWSPEDYVRLQEILFRIGQECHARQRFGDVPLPTDCWERVHAHVGSTRKGTDVVYLAHHILEFGIQKSMHEIAVHNNSDELGPSAIGIPGHTDYSMHSPGPGSVGSYDSWRAPGSYGAASLPNMGSGGLSAITNSFRTPKEPRITVWHPETGKTISGNAAPCRRNLESWMAQHPGWVPKAETQLSSARRSRAKKARPMSVPTATAIPIAGASLEHMPHLSDAVQGLLDLGCSVGSYNSNSGFLGGGSLGKPPSSLGRSFAATQKNKHMSSVSSSGAENEDEDQTDSEDDEMEM